VKKVSFLIKLSFLTMLASEPDCGLHEGEALRMMGELRKVTALL